MKTQTLSSLIFIGLIFVTALLLAIVPGFSIAHADDPNNASDDTLTTSSEAGGVDDDNDAMSDDSDSDSNNGDDNKGQRRVQDLRNSFKDRVDAAKEIRATNALERDAKKEERKTDRQAEQEERRTDLEEKRTERKNDLDDRRKGRIKAFAERILKRFNAAIERISKMADRVDSRIDKFEERGLDMSGPQALVDTARVHLTDAENDVADAMAQIELLLESDNPKEIFEKVRELLSSAKDSIKRAHASLVEAIRAIKADLPEPENTDSKFDGVDGDE